MVVPSKSHVCVCTIPDHEQQTESLDQKTSVTALSYVENRHPFFAIYLRKCLNIETDGTGVVPVFCRVMQGVTMENTAISTVCGLILVGLQFYQILPNHLANI